MRQTITALALVKILWDSYRRDQLDALLPLLAILIQRRGLSQISDTRELQRCFDQEWGLQIPYHALSAVLNRAKKRGLLTRSTKTFYPVLGMLREYAEEEKAAERRDKVQALLEGLCTFAEERLGSTVTIADAQDALIAYLTRHSADLQLLSGWDSALPEVTAANRSLFIFAAYAEEIRGNSAPEFRTLQEVWFGNALIEAVALPSPEKLRAKLKRLNLYLDAPVVFPLLGVSGEEAREATRELLDTAKRQGATLKVFHHTYDEVFGILESAVPWLQDLSGYDPSRASASLRFFVENGYKPSDVEEILSSLASRLEAEQVRLVASPSAVKNMKYQIDETELEATIRGIYWSTPTSFTIQRDIQSIAAIYRLRRDRLPRTVAKTRHVFLTTNHSLAIASRRYEERYVSNSFFIPAALTDIFLGTVLWLESPGSFERLNRLQLVSDIRSLLEPSDAVMRQFVRVVDELESRGDIDPAEVVALKCSPVARRLLHKVTLGDPDGCTYQTPGEILEQIKNGVRLEERERAAESLQQAEREREKEEREKVEVSRSAEAVKKRVARVADQIGILVAWVVYLGTSAVVIALAAFVVLGTEADGWVKTAAVGASIVITALGVVIPVKDVWTLCSRLRLRVARWVSRVFFDIEEVE